MKRSNLIIIIICISALCFLMISESFAEGKQTTNTNETSVVELSAENYNSEISDGLVIVNFTSPWCVMCRHSKPMLEEIAEEYKGIVKTGIINAASNKRFTLEHHINTIPSTLIYKNNKEVVRITGRATKEEIKRIIEEIN